MRGIDSALTARTDVPGLLNKLWGEAIERGASDIHVEPIPDGCEIRFRVDGLLRTEMTVSAETGRSLVLRMMVLAHLLTYRLDVPQEGRAAIHVRNSEIEIRISVIPTIAGLRGAVRLPAANEKRELGHLGLSHAIVENLYRFARADSGMLLVTGPAGSGKTTTIYALLAHLAGLDQGLSIVTLEDPAERAIAGITQIEVKPFGQLTYEKALRSILRQDPQVLMLGEIRDAATAQLAIQAAMSGHRLISTLHAGTAAGAIARLLEMGVEPYQITSSVWGVLGQRLLRRYADPNSRDSTSRGTAVRSTAAIDDCSAQYHGRMAVGELLVMDGDLRSVLLERPDARRLEEAASAQLGFVSLRAATGELVKAGVTDQSEMDRVLGG